MDMRCTLSEPLRFALRLVAWSLPIFGLFRLPWVGAHVLLPLTRLQAAAGSAIFGSSAVPVQATLACSGADTLALCGAAVLAYPARWSLRASGVAAGAVFILALNTIRIGTLSRAAASPRWFDALHLFVWPVVLTLAIGAFVFTWMRIADGWRPGRGTEETAARRPAPDGIATARFAALAAAFLLVFVLASPLYFESGLVMGATRLVARAAAFVLRALGVEAVATAGVLATSSGAFLVTPDCLATPLIPIYLAAVVSYLPSWRLRALWAAAAAPLFMALGVARLLAVAVPGLGASPSFAIHAFFQVVVAAGVVCSLAWWRYGARPATCVRVVAALALGVAFVRLLGAAYTHAIPRLVIASTVYDDPQGALLFLPAFQVGLYLAIWIAAFVPAGWTRFACGAALLVALQVGVAGSLDQLMVHTGFVPMVRDIRAWALLGPALVVVSVVNLASPRR